LTFFCKIRTFHTYFLDVFRTFSNTSCMPRMPLDYIFE
jgi:hypothetical protein